MSVPDAPDDLDLVKARDALNAMCKPSIAVTACRPAPDGWHARFNARSRTYVYAILGGDAPDPFLAGTTLYHPEPLDLATMQEAAGHLAGEHDFSSFGRPSEAGASTVRTLFELDVEQSGRLIRIPAAFRTRSSSRWSDRWSGRSYTSGKGAGLPTKWCRSSPREIEMPPDR